jgi:hypothetical protein
LLVGDVDLLDEVSRGDGGGWGRSLKGRGEERNACKQCQGNTHCIRLSGWDWQAV